MAIYSLGGNAGDAPFNRTFFNVTLGDVLERIGKTREHKLTLYLTDGSTLDVCNIDELADAYLALRAYAKDEEGCEVSVQLIPYSLIYRIELIPRAEENNRVGFHWAPPGKKGHTGRRSPR
jgi:hypothetical protein